MTENPQTKSQARWEAEEAALDAYERATTTIDKAREEAMAIVRTTFKAAMVTARRRERK